MKIEALDKIEKNGIENLKFDRFEKMSEVNKSFRTSLQPENGVYGVIERELSNGMREVRTHNELGYLKREIYNQDGRLTHTIEKIADNTRQMTKYDDNGIPFLKETSVRGDNPSHTIKLAPDVTITEGNFTAVTDHYGRPIINKIENVTIDPDAVRKPLSSKLRDSSYLENDHRGHLIADHLGGPASKENIVPQTEEVNLSRFKTVENKIESLVSEGKKVDYEVKSNYDGRSERPSSFEVRIFADGVEVPLDKDISKIYNGDLSSAEKVLTNAREGINKVNTATAPMREVGRQQGIEAATITFAISTVDNVILFVDGEISADEMAINIAKDTGTAGALGYGTGFITKGVAIGMSQSSNQLIQSLAGSNVPAAMVSFGVASYDTIIDFAQGEIDITEFAYDMGNNAVGVSGSMLGAQYGAVVGQAVIPIPGVGAVAGGLVGGMVGYAVTTGAYKTAVEYGSKGADALGAKAKQIAGATIEYAQENVPEKAADVKAAINTFAAQNNLPFNFA